MQITNAVYQVIRDSTSDRIDGIERNVNDLRFLLREILADLDVARKRGFDVPETTFQAHLASINQQVTQIQTTAAAIELYGEDTLQNLGAAAAALEAERGET